MRFILKGLEPQSLSEYRAKPDSTYDGPNFTSVKTEVRQQLLHEQGYLCCYCMKRIENSELKTKIEHWHCQNRYPAEQLKYLNLLAACDGNCGVQYKDQHCDTKKANSDILYNPSDPDHKTRLRIQYNSNGEISSADPVFNEQINTVLNLNFSRLTDNRKAIQDAITQALNNSSGTRTRAEISDKIKKWQTLDQDGKLKEFCDVAIYYLEKKLLKVQ
jgi:uncharacterized protein (TIGR02646 family)